MNRLDYFENIQVVDVELTDYDKNKFAYASKTSIHSLVTDWAFGEVLKRDCVDISDGKVQTGKFTLNTVNKVHFLKIIACMPDWQKLVLPLTVEVNGVVVYDEKQAFFEQVNLGWPALYIKLPKTALKVGENTVSVKADGGLYLSLLSLVCYPEVNDLEQISIRKFVKKGKRFGVAVKDINSSFVKVQNLKNCEFIEKINYKDFCVLSFNSVDQGEIYAEGVFGDKVICLDTPKAVDNCDDFVFGIDSDDHRHDNSDETSFIIETVIFSDMGDFIQFRPQRERNFYKILSKEGFSELVNLISAFGIKYGLCDTASELTYLPDIKPQDFYGYHIHEPYLFFNPALLENPYQSEKYFCDPEKMYSSKSFGESKALYMDVLRRSKKAFSRDVGSTSFGSPSLLCIYEGESGADRITIEPVSNLNLLTGAVRTTGVKKWGAHVPTDWYFGVPVDVIKSNKYRLAMQYLYLNGASYLYAENALFKTNAFERCDWESEHSVINRQYQREFYDYAINNPRKGELIVDKAIVYGRNEFFMWKLNDRIAELKEKDWDSHVWGKWDNAYQIAWNCAEAWLPASNKQKAFESPLNKDLFSGTPYGNVDVVSAEKDFSKYSQLAFLGWNTMDDDLIEKLKNYVEDGGTLAISYSHFNYTDTNDLDMIYPESSKIKDLIGLDVTGYKVAGNKALFNDKTEYSFDKQWGIAVGDLLTAKTICQDENGNGLVYENAYGKGKVYFIAFKEYITNENDIKLISHVLEIMGKDGDILCDNNNVSFTVRHTEEKYYISVLNMNCVQNADEEFTINFKGRIVSGKVNVGEIKQFTIDK